MIGGGTGLTPLF